MKRQLREAGFSIQIFTRWHGVFGIYHCTHGTINPMRVTFDHRPDSTYCTVGTRTVGVHRVTSAEAIRSLFNATVTDGRKTRGTKA
jgi:hypothetical protein